MLLRKKFHNKLVELRGNIRVLCRVRPTIQEDGMGAQAAVVTQTDREDDGVLRVLTKGSWKSFEVDRVFGFQSTQEQVGNPLVLQHTHSGGLKVYNTMGKMQAELLD